MLSPKKIFTSSLLTFTTLIVSANDLPKIKLTTDLSSCKYSTSSFETTTASNTDPIQIRFGREIPYVAVRSTTGAQVKGTVKTVFDGLSFSMIALAKERDIELEIKAEKTDVVMENFTGDDFNIQGPNVTTSALNKKLVIPNGKSATMLFGECVLKINAEIIPVN